MDGMLDVLPHGRVKIANRNVECGILGCKKGLNNAICVIFGEMGCFMGRIMVDSLCLIGWLRRFHLVATLLGRSLGWVLGSHSEVLMSSAIPSWSLGHRMLGRSRSVVMP